MNKEESAKIMAVKYILDLNSFKSNWLLKEDLVAIRRMYGGDSEYEELFDRYCEDLRGKDEPPRWARLVMAERYSINI